MSDTHRPDRYSLAIRMGGAMRLLEHLRSWPGDRGPNDDASTHDLVAVIANVDAYRMAAALAGRGWDPDFALCKLLDEHAYGCWLEADSAAGTEWARAHGIGEYCAVGERVAYQWRGRQTTGRVLSIDLPYTLYTIVTDGDARPVTYEFIAANFGAQAETD